MPTEDLIQTIKRELPALLRSDPALRRFILDITRESYADRGQTEDRFDRILDELRRDREQQARKWDEQNQKWEEQNRKWDEHNRRLEEQNQKWDEQNRRWEEQNRRLEEQNQKWAEQNRRWEEQNQKWDEENRRLEEQNQKWDEQNRKWEEQNRKWDESGKRFDCLHEEIMAQAKKFDRSVGALGARWGLQSEAAFRNALAGILEETFGVEVIHVNEYDEQGDVFGQPDQVELDVIIKNGLLLICELKSSMTKADMYTFERKVRFYERRHRSKADRMIAVSPMIDPQAQRVASRLGIETYSDSLEVSAGPGAGSDSAE